MFLVVTAMELYGTAIGSWKWAATMPGTGIPNGDPPSGVVGGYLLFDVVALALAPSALAALTKTGNRMRTLTGRNPAYPNDEARYVTRHGNAGTRSAIARV